MHVLPSDVLDPQRDFTKTGGVIVAFGHDLRSQFQIMLPA